jgi:riboflavin kinase / FMN adenylyltransferase
MQIIENILEETVDYSDMVLTIGSFDGVHRGHQRILSRLTDEARSRKGTAALMTLEPHPRQVFSPENAPNLLTCREKKAELLARAGLDAFLILPFSRETASMTPEAFLKAVIVDRCGAKKLVAGHDFAFGRNGEGDYEFLAAHAPAFGIEVEQVAALHIQGERVSSTLIRERLLQGAVENIDIFLGRFYAMRGTVASGRGIGRQLGFPTANIRPDCGLVPAHGVYAAEVLAGDERHAAAVNIGIAPTIRHDSAIIEAHLLGFDGDLTGAEIEIIFRKHLRTEQKFPSREALMAAIAADIQQVRDYFAGPDGTHHLE